MATADAVFPPTPAVAVAAQLPALGGAKSVEEPLIFGAVGLPVRIADYPNGITAVNGIRALALPAPLLTHTR